MAPRQLRRSRSLLLPIALTAAATAATIGLWYWLESSDDHSHHHHHHSVESASESESESHHPPRSHRRQKSDPPHRLRLHTVDEESEVSSTISHQPKPSPSSRYSTLSSRKYVPPPKKRIIALVINAESPQSTLLASLPHPLPIPSNTTLHILIYTPARSTTVSSTSISSAPAPPSQLHEMAYSILPTEYPKEYILPYTKHPTGTSAILSHISPEVVYIEEGLVGSNGEVLKDLLERSRIGEGIVVLGTGIPSSTSKPELAGLLDSDDDMEKIEHGEAIVPGGPDSKGKEKSTSQVVIGGVNSQRKWWQAPAWDGARGGGSVVERQFLAEDWTSRVVERG